MRLTARQRAVLEFIKKHVADRGFPPTVREIAAHFGFASPLSAQLHIDALVKKGFLRKSGSRQRALEVLGLRPAGGIRIPLLKKISTDIPIITAEEIENYINVDRALFKSEDSFAIKVEGDSMIDAGIFQGDIALIDPQVMPENGDIVIVIIGDEILMRRFYKEKERIRLVPENRQMKSIILHEEYVKIMGRVIGVLRKF